MPKNPLTEEQYQKRKALIEMAMDLIISLRATNTNVPVNLEHIANGDFLKLETRAYDKIAHEKQLADVQKKLQKVSINNSEPKP